MDLIAVEINGEIYYIYKMLFLIHMFAGWIRLALGVLMSWMMNLLLGFSRGRIALALFCVTVGSLFSASLAFANSSKITYEIPQGYFVVLGEGNPWGGDGYGLDFSMQLTFLLPSTADLFPDDPKLAQWITPASASITANGTTVEYFGPAKIGLNSFHLEEGQGKRTTAAWFSLPGLYVDLTCYNDYAPEGFSSDSVDNLLLLNGAVDVFSNGCYTDLDRMSLTSVTPVPDTSMTGALLGGLLVGFVLFRGQFARFTA